MKKRRFPLKDQFTAIPEGRMARNEEQAMLDTTEMICEIMGREKISRAQLAERLGISTGRVSQILDGTANITIRTLARILTVLGCEFRPGCVMINGTHHAETPSALRDSAERLMPSNADLMKLPDSAPAAEWWGEESPF